MGKVTSLRNGREFARVFRAGKRGRSDGVVVVAAASGDGPARVGMSIKRTAGSAVARNRARRRLRSMWPSLDVPAGCEVVIQMNAEAVQRPYQELEKHVQNAMVKAGVTV